MRPTMQIRSALALACALATLAGAERAGAQNALGDGRALDANSRVGAGGRNTDGRRLSSELAFRNAIVTGNAPGGLDFRGDVGYTSPFDFRGTLGSDDLFAFRRDSFFSGLGGASGQGLRGVDALQFQLGMSLAGSFDNTGPSPIITRTGAPSPGRIDPNVISLDAGAANLYDPLRSRPGALRATSEFVVGDALSPKLLASGDAADGSPRFTMASPLRSVSLDRSPSGVADPFRPIPSRTEDEATRPGQQDNRVSGRIEPRKASQQVVLDALRAREDAAQEDGDEAAPADGAQPFETLEQRLERLRDELEGDPAADEQPSDTPETAAERVGRLTREALEGRETTVRSLAPAGNEERDFFAEHMERGQALLAEDRWFEAEERFTSALLLNERDVFAHAGRIHAQLGAGLFRSAAENLKQLIRRHPEMLAVEFDPALLPRADRLATVTGELQNRVAGDSEFARDCALLLAYLGRQYSDDAMLRDAFEAMDRIAKRLGDPDPVFSAARAAWLDG
jgi:tetratricopeptide (TPR) repeat protein